MGITYADNNRSLRLSMHTGLTEALNLSQEYHRGGESR
jgi:hypothetical protein